MKKIVSKNVFFAAAREAVKNLFTDHNTVLFPAENVDVPNDLRGTPTLIAENCTLCNRCVRVCPTWALSIEKLEGSLANFTVDLGRCCYCQECELTCPFDAIHLKPDWLTSSMDRENIKRVSKVNKPSKKKEK